MWKGNRVVYIRFSLIAEGALIWLCDFTVKPQVFHSHTHLMAQWLEHRLEFWTVYIHSPALCVKCVLCTGSPVPVLGSLLCKVQRCPCSGARGVVRQVSVWRPHRRRWVSLLFGNKRLEHTVPLQPLPLAYLRQHGSCFSMLVCKMKGLAFPHTPCSAAILQTVGLTPPAALCHGGNIYFLSLAFF